MNILEILLLYILVLIIGANNTNAQVSNIEGAENLFDRQILIPTTSEYPITQLFQFSLLKANLPGGVFASECYQPKSYKTGLPAKTTIEEVLNFIDKSDSEYKWEINEGLLNLLPSNTESGLLSLPLKEFKAENVTVSEALEILLNKPEVKQKKTELDLDRAVFRYYALGTYYEDPAKRPIEPRFNFNLQDKNFRQILNIIAKKEGHKKWTYIEKHCGKSKEFGVYFVN